MDQDTFHRLVALNAVEQLKQARGAAMGEQQAGPHSLEHVATVNGVDYINDSRSTFLDATLRSMSDLERPVIWIAGSLPSDIGQAHVRDFLKEHIVALVLFGRSDMGITALKPFTEHVYFAEEVRTAVFLARELARDGETVLFSPACPSGGDGFANYEERGAEFKRAVKDL